MFFLESKAIPDFCSFCCMIASEYNLSFSNLLGESSLHSVSIQRKGNEISIDDVLMDSYVSCLYKKEWYDGMLKKIIFWLSFCILLVYQYVFIGPAIEDKYWLLVNHLLQLILNATVTLKGAIICF